MSPRAGRREKTADCGCIKKTCKHLPLNHTDCIANVICDFGRNRLLHSLKRMLGFDVHS